MRVTPGAAWVNTTSARPVGQFSKQIARLVGRIGLGVRVSASLKKKNARLMGLLRSGPRLVAYRCVLNFLGKL